MVPFVRGHFDDGLDVIKGTLLTQHLTPLFDLFPMVTLCVPRGIVLYVRTRSCRAPAFAIFVKGLTAALMKLRFLFLVVKLFFWSFEHCRVQPESRLGNGHVACPVELVGENADAGRFLALDG